MIDNDIKLDFSDVLIVPKPNALVSRNDVNLEREFQFTNSGRIWTGIPIMVANMDTTGTIDMVRQLQDFHILTCLHKFYEPEDIPIDELNPDYFAISCGTSEKELEKLGRMVEKVNPHFICLDVANGYRHDVIEKIKHIRKIYPGITLIAGNVVTPEIVKEYYENGVDIVKMGIGSGSVCTTRLKTGVGYPQFSCIIDTKKEIPENCFIISDGGIQTVGDFSKAYGAGADFVMAGGMFAGHDECSGETIEENGTKYKIFYGMSSANAMNKHYGGVASYRSSEGKCVKLKYRGPVQQTVEDILGGIRSTMTYVGAKQMNELHGKCSFIRVNNTVNRIYNNNEV
jgi:GMP reductase